MSEDQLTLNWRAGDRDVRKCYHSCAELMFLSGVFSYLKGVRGGGGGFYKRFPERTAACPKGLDMCISLVLPL